MQFLFLYKNLIKIITMSKKILLVDDDLYIRELYNEILENEGYEVETAANGEAGLNKITNNKYDLILLDIMMPKLDGIGILTKLKDSQSSTPLSSIILLTNLANDPVIKEVAETGIKKVLIKSDITPEELTMEVKKTLGVKQTEKTDSLAAKADNNEDELKEEKTTASSGSTTSAKTSAEKPASKSTTSPGTGKKGAKKI